MPSSFTLELQGLQDWARVDAPRCPSFCSCTTPTWAFALYLDGESDPQATGHVSLAAGDFGGTAGEPLTLPAHAADHRLSRHHRQARHVAAPGRAGDRRHRGHAGHLDAGRIEPACQRGGRRRGRRRREPGNRVDDRPVRAGLDGRRGWRNALVGHRVGSRAERRDVPRRRPRAAGKRAHLEWASAVGADRARRQVRTARPRVRPARRHAGARRRATDETDGSRRHAGPAVGRRPARRPAERALHGDDQRRRSRGAGIRGGPVAVHRTRHGRARHPAGTPGKRRGKAGVCRSPMAKCAVCCIPARTGSARSRRASTGPARRSRTCSPAGEAAIGRVF